MNPKLQTSPVKRTRVLLLVAGIIAPTLLVAACGGGGPTVGSARVDQAEIEDQVDLVLEDAYDAAYYIDCPGDLVAGEDLECDSSVEGGGGANVPSFDAVTVQVAGVDGEVVNFEIDFGEEIRLSGSASAQAGEDQS